MGHIQWIRKGLWGRRTVFSHAAGGTAFTVGLVFGHFDLVWQVEIWQFPEGAVSKQQVTFRALPDFQLQQETCTEFRDKAYTYSNRFCSGATCTPYRDNMDIIQKQHTVQEQHLHGENMYTVQRQHLHSSETTSTQFRDIYTVQRQHLHSSETFTQFRDNIYTVQRQHLHNSETTFTQFTANIYTVQRQQ